MTDTSGDRVSPIDPVAMVLVCAAGATVDCVAFGFSVREVLLAVVCAVALAARRRTPAISLAAVTIALAVQTIELHAPSALHAVGLIILYSSWSWGGVATRAAATVLALFGSAAGGLLDNRLPANTAAEAAGVTALFYAALAGAACVSGQLARTRRQLIDELRARAERTEAAQRQQAALLAARERTQLARDVHDVVAHSLTVIAVQAQSGRFAADADPAAAITALDAITTAAKDALGDVRDVLHQLRSPHSAERITVRAFRRRADELGLPATVSESGVPHPVSPAVAETAHRVVQEALTNTLRHAGASAQVTIELAWREADLALDVSNRGGGLTTPMTTGSGLGLVGMRERVSAVGGRLEYGPTDDGFAVHATLPYAGATGDAWSGA